MMNLDDFYRLQRLIEGREQCIDAFNKIPDTFNIQMSIVIDRDDPVELANFKDEGKMSKVNVDGVIREVKRGFLSDLEDLDKKIAELDFDVSSMEPLPSMPEEIKEPS